MKELNGAIEDKKKKVVGDHIASRVHLSWSYSSLKSYTPISVYRHQWNIPQDNFFFFGWIIPQDSK